MERKDETRRQLWRYLISPAAVVTAVCLAVFGGMIFLIRRLGIGQDAVRIVAFCGLVVLAAMAVMVFWIWRGARKITGKRTQDFDTILEAMKKAREGDLDSFLRLDPDNEFLEIGEAYNGMIRSLKSQMEKNRKMSELVAVSQMRQLESQFKPHFLFNTLENIRYMYKIDPAGAEQMILSLSNLLRYSQENGESQVPLKKDLVYLENYLSILKYRYGRRLVYEVDVTEEARSCLIPRLMVQPLIENAVKYGFGNKENLRIELKAYCHEGKLVMICRDDGTGMSAGTLAEVTASLEQEENRSGHLGLYNIHRRIYLLYGAPYGVEIRSQEDHGTTVVVSFPARREDGLC
ncbi:MAG: sensor histidine kinase [Eubacteriales bacterium]|nr:sensor histidine kinase [Eubacteriales bacterium]